MGRFLQEVRSEDGEEIGEIGETSEVVLVVPDPASLSSTSRHATSGRRLSLRLHVSRARQFYDRV